MDGVYITKAAARAKAPEADLKEQQKRCLKCLHCCTYEVIPLGKAEEEILELVYHKGHNAFWDPINKGWYLSIYKPCQHLKFGRCQIYNKRPSLCKSWMCNHPAWMSQRYDILMKAGKRILKHKFGGN